ncbi:oxygenase MpaB family protein [Nocardia sp. NPDC051570]|uniref:oxygenase MpaB family protein n=1 Tax=Nocardia sp. NPDC051570 TaxID=3364324 RepID=UPI00379DEB61
MAGNILTDARLAATLRREDYGFFGPNSVSWQVWSHPAMLLGLQRAISLQFLNPFFAAAHEDAQAIYQRPAHFYDITLSFVLSGIFGDSRTALETSDFIMKIHTHVKGVEPISGQRYHANSPEAQLYTHVCTWHSVLKCYEVFGPGPLEPAAEQQYWAQCAIAAELFTCKPADVPSSRDGVREYYTELRPRLCVSDHAISGMRQQFYTSGPYADLKIAAVSRIGTPATLATMPTWIRQLTGLDQSALVDAASIPLFRTVLRTVAASHRATWTAVRIAAPISGRIVRQHFLATRPHRADITTPAAARKVYGRVSHKNSAGDSRYTIESEAVR